jgi:hypothetical protein
METGVPKVNNIEPFEYRDDGAVKEVFADGVVVTYANTSIARIVLSVSRTDAPKPDRKATTGYSTTACRVAMPTAAFLELYNQMHTLVRRLEKNGFVLREGDAIKPTLQ